MIDVRDLAAWIVTCAEQRTTGDYDGVGEVLPAGELLARVAAGVGATPELTEPASTNVEEEEALGGAIVVGGLITAGVGATSMIIGGRKVPVAPAKNAASAAPELVLGPRYAGLRWSM
ncbi:hypothetical protein WME97_11975 [Sorangium sp. So ce367]|uniref:hypothetical protein n=1 Tax=Sorangium sp. So ce367 TaxID=3133305 RepID=UPI003F606A80